MPDFRTYFLVCATTLHLSCVPGHERNSTTAPAAGASVAATPRETLAIASNTQATIDDVKIGAGNFREGEYESAGGIKETGRTAALWVSVRDDPSADRSIRVGAGSRFSAGRFSFEVLEVTGDTVRIRFSPPLRPR